VVFDSVSKSYARGHSSSSHTPALSQLSQRISPGECFALLGANGAGKTTAIKVLTGEVEPDSGDAFIAGYSVTHQLAAVQRCIGYSPQFEALTPGLTGRELLLLYAALRGIKSKQQAAEMAQQLLQGLQLVELADVPCGAYSGGNRARLSVAVAVVAHLQLVLLDEPSTGMDAAARHALWKVLQVRQQASSGTELTDGNYSRRETGKLSFGMKLLLDKMTLLLASCKPGP
jgi:ABC-type multidrug transport system ATPase subunit